MDLGRDGNAWKSFIKTPLTLLAWKTDVKPNMIMVIMKFNKMEI